MIFQPIKCNMMQLTKKLTNKIQASYTLEGKVLENVQFIKHYLIYLMILSRSFSDHHLRCGRWLNFEFNKRGNTFWMGH